MKPILYILSNPVIIMCYYLPMIIGTVNHQQILYRLKYFVFNPFFLLFLISPYLLPKKKIYILVYAIFGWVVLVLGIAWHIEVLSYPTRGPEVGFILVLGFVHSLVYYTVVNGQILIIKSFYKKRTKNLTND